MTRDDLSGLESRIGHVFARQELAVRALTHISSLTGEGGRVGSYQRLEFLGDRVLGLAVASMLYAEFPHADEGELSRRLAELVRKESCAEVGAAWGLGDDLRLGASEAQFGARGRPAILADVCEALIGAVFLDGGFPAAAAVVEAAWKPRMLSPRRALRDAKTTLQEWAQGLGRPTPVYREMDRSGPAHAPRFVIAVSVAGFPAAEGSGASKRIAEQAAAAAFLQREGFGEPPIAGLVSVAPAERTSQGRGA
jgi:ribonuclease-3